MSSTKARQRHTEKEKHSESTGFKKELLDDRTAKKASRRWIHAFLIAFTASIFIPLLLLIVWPSPITPVIIEGLSEPPEYTGPLEPNNALTFAERIYVNHVQGPESIVVDGDHIYTGTADGWVNHIHKGVVQKIVRFGKEPCGGHQNEVTCGRPLGMRMDKNGFLIVADAYYGLFKLNVVTGDYIPLYLSTAPINGKEAKFINDLDIAPDGKIYFTDTSTKWQRNQFHMIFLEGNPNGRLLMYDPATSSTTQLLDGLLFANGVQLTKDKSAVLVTALTYLVVKRRKNRPNLAFIIYTNSECWSVHLMVRNWNAEIIAPESKELRLLMYDPATSSTTQLLDGLLFANGVQLTKDKSAVLVTETFKARIMKYDLKTKQATIWADNLPGAPDNIRYNKVTGTYWVGLASNRQKGRFSLMDYLSSLPWLRGLLAKVMSVTLITKMREYARSTDSQTMAIELNESGTIIRSIHDKTGEVIISISEVESSDGVLYFGSYYSNFIAKDGIVQKFWTLHV